MDSLTLLIILSRSWVPLVVFKSTSWCYNKLMQLLQTLLVYDTAEHCCVQIGQRPSTCLLCYVHFISFWQLYVRRFQCIMRPWLILWILTWGCSLLSADKYAFFLAVQTTVCQRIVRIIRIIPSQFVGRFSMSLSAYGL